MDEKGLAAIFIFGLPGFSRSNPALRCLAAGIEVIEVMNSGDIPCTAGLDTGPCFCGLVGDPTRRCEYAVLGGEGPASCSPSAAPRIARPVP